LVIKKEVSGVRKVGSALLTNVRLLMTQPHLIVSQPSAYHDIRWNQNNTPTFAGLKCC